MIVGASNAGLRQPDPDQPIGRAGGWKDGALPFMTNPDLLDMAAPLDRFRALVMADPTLQQRLAVYDDPADFVAAAVAAAAEAQITFGEEAMRAAIHRDPLDLARFGDRAVTGLAVPEGDWLPTAVVPAAGQLAVDWAHFGGKPLVAPFFSDSLRIAGNLPLNRLIRVRTPLSELAATLGEEGAVPDGFIFHLSRCGSTLVAQMLAADSNLIVVSEAAPIDSVVQLAQSRSNVPLKERVRLLRAMVGALGRNRAGGGLHYIVKLDSWHIFALPLFRLAFPDTPWVFLYRDPVEVLVSHDRVRGVQTVWGTMPYDPYRIEGGAEMPAEQYSTRVLGLTAAAAVEHSGLGGGLLVNYAELPDAAEARILPHFGIHPDAETRAAMALAAGRDAKSPIQAFIGDVREKQQEANDRIRSLAEAYLNGPYRQLEAIRTAVSR